MSPSGIKSAVEALRQAAAARKCWQCGCLRSSVRAIEEEFPTPGRPEELAALLQDARRRLAEVKYDCLGCEVCWPAIAVNELGVEGDACPAEAVKEREGWPPLPGSYSLLRYHAPVGICTLTDERLQSALAASGAAEVSLVGTMHTENLGIERLVQNTVANPNIRFLIVCGADSRQAVGHLPGQSLLSLARFGVDERMRIIGAQGKRPVLHNLSREAVEHFRKSVEVVDCIGQTDLVRLLVRVKECVQRNPGLAVPFDGARSIEILRGYLPQRVLLDPSGYFVVLADRGRKLLVLEHYHNDGVLDNVIEGYAAAEVYTPAIERGLVSRLDHAAYLGQQLARAERALRTGEPYIQDAAPELGGGERGSQCNSPTCKCH